MCLLVIVKLQIIRYCEDITHFMEPIFVHFTNGHDITEILLKVALNAISPKPVHSTNEQRLV